MPYIISIYGSFICIDLNIISRTILDNIIYIPCFPLIFSLSDILRFYLARKKGHSAASLRHFAATAQSLSKPLTNLTAIICWKYTYVVPVQYTLKRQKEENPRHNTFNSNLSAFMASFGKEFYFLT